MTEEEEEEGGEFVRRSNLYAYQLLMWRPVLFYSYPFSDTKRKLHIYLATTYFGTYIQDEPTAISAE